MKTLRGSSSWLRRTWPALAMLSAMACILVTLFEMERTARAQRAVIDTALSRYASFAAWSYAEHFTETLRHSSQELLGGVNMLHVPLMIPNARDLVHSLHWAPACDCLTPTNGPLPLAFAAFTLGSDTMAVATNHAPPGAPGWTPADRNDLPQSSDDSPFSSAGRTWMNHVLTPLARAPASQWGYQLLVARYRDSTYTFTLTNMPTVRKDTIVYVAMYSERTLDSLLSNTLDNPDLLPNALTIERTNRQILAAEVRDASGRVLLASGVPERWRRDGETAMPIPGGSLRVRMAIEPALADRLVIGGTPASRLPMLLVLLGIATTLATFSVAQIRREAHFTRQRTAFLASTSHELRTPLAQLRLVIDTLALGREPDPARRAVSMALMDREVIRMQHLVDTVLHFTRGEQIRGAVAAASGPVDLAAETAHVVEEFTPLAAAQGMTIALAGDTTVQVVIGASAVRQIVLNLLDNAVKYGGRGQVVRVAVNEIPGSKVEITVDDSGPGVPVAERESIWLPFERGSAARESAVAGSGIGLTVVRDLARAHRGDTRVESGADGARVVVTLPLAN